MNHEQEAELIRREIREHNQREIAKATARNQPNIT